MGKGAGTGSDSDHHYSGSQSDASSFHSQSHNVGDQLANKVADEDHHHHQHHSSVVTAIFGLLFSVSKEREVSSRFTASIQLLLEWYQLFLLIFTASYRWKFESQHLGWKILSSPVLYPIIENKYEIYMALLYVSVGLFVIYLALCGWIIFCFTSQEYPFSWAVKLVKSFNFFFCFTFYTSIVNLFMISWHCHWLGHGDSIFGQHQYFKDKECFEVSHLSNLVVSAIFLVFFVAISFLVTLTDVEFHLASRRPLASAISQTEAECVVFKTLFVMNLVFFRGWPKVMSMDALLLSLWMLSEFFQKQPHLHPWANHCRVGIYASVSYLSFMFVLIVYKPWLPGFSWETWGEYITNTALIGMVPFALLGMTLSHWRLNALQQIIWSRFANAHPEAKAKAIYRFSGVAEVEIASRVARKWIDEDMLDPEATKRGDIIIRAGMELFGGQSSMIVLYSNYLIDMLHKYQTGYSQLQGAKKAGPSLLDRFAIFSREQEHMQGALGGRSGENAVDLLSYVEFQRSHRHSLHAHRQALAATRAFWKSLLMQRVSYTNMLNHLHQIDQHTQQAEHVYRLVLQRYPNSTKLVRNYAKFLEVVKNDPWSANKYYTEAAKLAEAADEERQKGFDHNEEGDEHMGMLAHVDERRSAVVIINAQGEIQLVNQTAFTMFGYKKGDLEGKNISVVIPPPYNSRHQLYLRAYVQTGKEYVIGRTLTWFAMHRLRHAFECKIAVSKVSGTAQDSIFMAVIQEVPRDASVAKAQVTTKGLFACADSTFFDWFGHDREDLTGTPVADYVQGQDRITYMVKEVVEAEFGGTASTVGVFSFHARLRHRYLSEGVHCRVTVRLGGTDRYRLLNLAIRRAKPPSHSLMVIDRKGHLVHVDRSLADMISIQDPFGLALARASLATLLPQPFSTLHTKLLRDPDSHAIPPYSCRTGMTTVCLVDQMTGTQVPVTIELQNGDPVGVGPGGLAGAGAGGIPGGGLAAVGVAERLTLVLAKESSVEQGLAERKIVLKLDGSGTVQKLVGISCSRGDAEDNDVFGFTPATLLGRKLSEFIDVFESVYQLLSPNGGNTPTITLDSPMHVSSGPDGHKRAPPRKRASRLSGNIAGDVESLPTNGSSSNLATLGVGSRSLEVSQLTRVNSTQSSLHEVSRLAASGGSLTQVNKGDLRHQDSIQSISAAHLGLTPDEVTSQLLAALVSQSMLTPGCSWRVGVTPPLPAEVVGRGHKGSVAAAVLKQQAKPAVMQLDIIFGQQDSNDGKSSNGGGVAGVNAAARNGARHVVTANSSVSVHLVLWAADHLSGVVEVDMAGHVINTTEHPLHDAGLLFGIPRISLLKQSIGKFMHMGGRDMAALFREDNAKRGGLKSNGTVRSGGNKVGPVYTLAGKHSDKHPLSISLQIVSKENTFKQAYLVMRPHNPSRGAESFLLQLLPQLASKFGLPAPGSNITPQGSTSGTQPNNNNSRPSVGSFLSYSSLERGRAASGSGLPPASPFSRLSGNAGNAFGGGGSSVALNLLSHRSNSTGEMARKGGLLSTSGNPGNLDQNPIFLSSADATAGPRPAMPTPPLTRASSQKLPSTGRGPVQGALSSGGSRTDLGLDTGQSPPPVMNSPSNSHEHPRSLANYSRGNSSSLPLDGGNGKDGAKGVAAAMADGPGVQDKTGVFLGSASVPPAKSTPREATGMLTDLGDISQVPRPPSSPDIADDSHGLAPDSTDGIKTSQGSIEETGGGYGAPPPEPAATDEATDEDDDHSPGHWAEAKVDRIRLSSERPQRRILNSSSMPARRMLGAGASFLKTNTSRSCSSPGTLPNQLLADGEALDSVNPLDSRSQMDVLISDFQLEDHVLQDSSALAALSPRSAGPMVPVPTRILTPSSTMHRYPAGIPPGVDGGPSVDSTQLESFSHTQIEGIQEFAGADKGGGENNFRGTQDGPTTPHSSREHTRIHFNGGLADDPNGIRPVSNPVLFGDEPILPGGFAAADSNDLRHLKGIQGRQLSVDAFDRQVAKLLNIDITSNSGGQSTTNLSHIDLAGGQKLSHYGLPVNAPPPMLPPTPVHFPDDSLNTRPNPYGYSPISNVPLGMGYDAGNVYGRCAINLELSGGASDSRYYNADGTGMRFGGMNESTGQLENLESDGGGRLYEQNSYNEGSLADSGHGDNNGISDSHSDTHLSDSDVQLADFRQGKRFKKLKRMITPINQRTLGKFKLHTIGVLAVLVAVHVGCYVCITQLVGKKVQNMKQLDSAGKLAYHVHEVATYARVIDLVQAGQAPAGVINSSLVALFAEHLGAAAERLRELHQSSFLGFDPARPRALGDDYNLSTIWSSNSRPLYVGWDYGEPSALYFNSTTTLWDLGNLFYGCAKEIQHQYGVWAASGVLPRETYDFQSLVANGLFALYTGYQETLEALVLSAVHTTNSINKLQLVLLIVEGVVLANLLAVYMWRLILHITEQRYKLLFVFLQLPIGLTRSLASQPIVIEEDSNDDDSSEEAEEAIAGASTIQVLSGDGGDPSQLLLNTLEARELSFSERLASSAFVLWLKGSLVHLLTALHLFHPENWRRKTLVSNKRRLRRDNHSNHFMMLPFLFWGLAVIIVYAWSYIALKDVAGPVASLLAINNTIASIARAIFFGQELAATEQLAATAGDAALRASANNALLNTTLSVMTRQYTLMLYGRTHGHLDELTTTAAVPFGGSQADGLGSVLNLLRSGVTYASLSDQNLLFRLNSCISVVAPNYIPPPDRIECLAANSVFGSVTRSAINGMVRRLSRELGLLLRDGTGNLTLVNNTRYAYLWEVGLHDLSNMLLLLDHGFLESVDEVYIDAQRAHLILFVLSWFFALFVLLFVLRPYLTQNHYETRRITDLLSHLPREVDVEGLVLKAIATPDPNAVVPGPGNADDKAG